MKAQAHIANGRKPTGRVLTAKPTKATGNGSATKPTGTMPKLTTIGQGIRQAFDGNLLYLVVDCSEAAYASAPTSASGKNKLLGSTQGTHYLPCPFGGDAIGVGLNVFRK